MSVAVEPKRGATTACRTNEEGECLFSVERDASYRVELHGMIGSPSAPHTNVIAPASGVELRVDALLVRIRAAAEGT